MVKIPAANAGDVGSIPGLWRSHRGGNGNPLQYYYLRNPMDRGAWRAKVTKVHKESDKTELLSTHALRLRIGWYVQERQAFLIQLLSLKRLPRGGLCQWGHKCQRIKNRENKIINSVQLALWWKDTKETNTEPKKTQIENHTSLGGYIGPNFK